MIEKPMSVDGLDHTGEPRREQPVLPAPHGNVNALARKLAQSAELVIAPTDWDLLFGAIKARLTLLVGGESTPRQAAAGNELPDWIRDNVLECVGALDLLHAALKHERAQLSQLEQEVTEAQETLARARAELVGTQAEERRARHMALHDDLTGLPNRGFFRERLDQALALSQADRPPIAVLYLDLDDFKKVNDTHGHDAGDEMLRIVAARLARVVRSGDMVSRLGGDEFACLLVNLPSRNQLSHLADKLLESVCAPITLGPLKLDVRSSIGIAMCPEHGTSSDMLLKHADAAMYQAKRLASGYAFFDAIARSSGMSRLSPTQN
jgi:diguanylate cyclase